MIIELLIQEVTHLKILVKGKVITSKYTIINEKEEILKILKDPLNLYKHICKVSNTSFGRIQKYKKVVYIFNKTKLSAALTVRY